MRQKVVRMSVAFGFLALCQTTSASAIDAGALAAHRAVYDLELKEASDRSGISGMFGRMVYEFNGSPCDGYTVSFRFVTQIATGDDTRLTDQQTTTFEDINDRTFSFVTRSYVDKQLDYEVKGLAEAGSSDIVVELEKPSAKTVNIAESKFPTEHMIDLITRAKDGERFYETRLFDGSDEGDKPMLTTTILGSPQKPKSDDKEATVVTGVSGEMFWPVSISYFDEVDSGDGLPVYQISFKLYEDGVTRDLVMDYGDFVLQGKLADIEHFDPIECPEN